MDNYPWYKTVDGNEPILQGDFVNSCPIVIPTLAMELEKQVSADVVEYEAQFILLEIYL